ncbi:MAG: glucose-1-phosphate cytidylyltransferase [Candidatus Eiseniibacteriota bacterium]
MKTVILAGGLGTRFAEETDIRPKPMIEIGDRPILWHIMQIYGAFGYRDFLVALGYRGDIIKSYFLNYSRLQSDFCIDLASGGITEYSGHRDDFLLHLIDTGPETQTGGRLLRLAEHLRHETFLMTYGDGVARLDIQALVAFHRRHGKLATLTAVRPPARFGRLLFDGDQVTRFDEKPQLGEGWINGGFFVLEPGVLDYIEGDETIWERDPLERLAADGQLMAYRSEDFWQCMDTLRDKRLLDQLWNRGRAPWAVWA